MKVSKQTVRNFLKAWEIMSDNPVDWQEVVYYNMKGNKEKAIEKVEKFIQDLYEFSDKDNG